MGEGRREGSGGGLCVVQGETRAGTKGVTWLPVIVHLDTGNMPKTHYDTHR